MATKRSWKEKQINPIDPVAGEAAEDYRIWYAQREKTIKQIKETKKEARIKRIEEAGGLNEVVIAKAREKYILKELINSVNKDMIFTMDKDIYRYRPDFFCDLKTHYVIIENDENSHMRYSKAKEENRIIELSEHLKKPLVVIRFNPSSYIKNGVMYEGMFGNGTEKNETIFTERISKLIETFLKYFDYNGKKMVVEYLFYQDIKIGFKNYKDVDVIIS